MNDSKIEITISRIGPLFFTNARLVTGEPLEDFVCTMGQSSLDMSIASAMPYIRDYAAKLQKFDLAEPMGPEDLKKCPVCGATRMVTRIKPDGSEDLSSLGPCFRCTPEGNEFDEDYRNPEEEDALEADH